MPITRTFAAALLLVIFSGWATCAAQDTVRIGGVEVPVDCALARKEHPRLLFTRADLPRLRAHDAARVSKLHRAAEALAVFRSTSTSPRLILSAVGRESRPGNLRRTYG